MLARGAGGGQRWWRRIHERCLLWPQASLALDFRRSL